MIENQSNFYFLQFSKKVFTFSNVSVHFFRSKCKYLKNKSNRNLKIGRVIIYELFFVHNIQGEKSTKRKRKGNKR